MENKKWIYKIPRQGGYYWAQRYENKNIYCGPPFILKLRCVGAFPVGVVDCGIVDNGEEIPRERLKQYRFWGPIEEPPMRGPDKRKQFIIDTIVEDYNNDGKIRELFKKGGKI